jgi:uncharacterized membrane protein YdjX (TVP38/TMEM64 family)
MSTGLLRIGRPAAFVIGLMCCILALRLLPTSAQDFGLWAGQLGAWRFCLIATLLGATGVPRQAIAFAGGYAYGLVLGSALALVCETFACLITVVWARFAARHWLASRLPQHWLAKLDRMIAAQPFVATLSLRLLPVGNNFVLNLAAGLLNVPIGRFVAASAIGYIPQTIIFALLGSGVRVDRSIEFAAGCALFALSILIGGWALRRQRTISGSRAGSVQA